jgi:cysteine-rich repeat protein
MKQLAWLLRSSALVLVSLVTAAGCGDDEDAVGGTAGKGGTKPTAGAPSTAGSNNNGGNDSGKGGAGAGEGGMPAGGNAGDGPVDAGGGGDGGDGGSPPVSKCGNGATDAGEECDDGNTKNGDGCSSTCTSKCEACEIAHCDYGDFGDVKELCFTETAGDTVVAGPATGAPRSKLCTELVECIRGSGCMQASNKRLISTSPFAECYCGPGGCEASAPATGPCKEEYRRASESTISDEAALDIDVYNKFYDFAGASGAALGLALGRASLVVQACDFYACGQECYRQEASDACQRCSLGPDASQSAAGDTVSCVNAAECEVNELCSQVLDCVQQTKCAGTDIVECYASGSGPCAAAITAAAGTSVVADITAALTRPIPAGGLSILDTARSVTTCQQTFCATECFPP